MGGAFHFPPPLSEASAHTAVPQLRIVPCRLNAGGGRCPRDLRARVLGHGLRHGQHAAPRIVPLGCAARQRRRGGARREHLRGERVAAAPPAAAACVCVCVLAVLTMTRGRRSPRKTSLLVVSRSGARAGERGEREGDASSGGCGRVCGRVCGCVCGCVWA